MGFNEGSEVVVKQEDDKNWSTRVTLTYEGRVETFVVPELSPTDFASVPKVFVWFLPRYGRYTKAAILHDYLWRERAKAGLISWKDADGIFCRAMRELDVPFLRRWIMWTAVRWASLRNRAARREPGLWRDLPRMIVLSVVAAPIVVPPALVILLALLLWLVVEAVAWVPLRLARELRLRLTGDTTPKEVNAPQLEWKS